MRVEPFVAEYQDVASEPEPVARPAGRTVNVEAALWIVVVAAAAGWRLMALGDALPGPAEGLQARAAWEFAQGTVPNGWTGYLSSALAALFLKVGSDGLGAVRLGPALFGAGCVAALFLLRPYVGTAVALLGALLLAGSPLAAASSRTLSPDTAGLLSGLLILWLVLKIGEDGDERRLTQLGAATGAALTTGAIAVVLALVAAVFVAIEIAWLDRDEVAERWRRALGDRALVVSALVLALPGLMLALVRFGAGPDRLTIAAFTDFSSMSPDAGAPLPWHATLTLFAAYEPLTLALGVAGAILIVRRWVRDGSAAVTVGERMLTVWLAVGTALALTALHQRQGQLLMVALPLMLLAASATVRLVATLAAFHPRWSGPPLAAAGIVLIFAPLKFLAWSRPEVQQLGIPSTREEWGVIILLIAALGLIAAGLYFSWRAAGGLFAAGAWIVFGWVTLHGTASVGFGDGNEMLQPFRPSPERVVLLRGIERALAERKAVAVERPIAAALAWELRGRDVLLFTGEPPRAPIVVRQSGAPPPPNSTSLLQRIPVGERWYPETWDAQGVLLWLFYRTAWGPTDSLVGDLWQTEDRG